MTGVLYAAVGALFLLGLLFLALYARRGQTGPAGAAHRAGALAAGEALHVDLDAVRVAAQAARTSALAAELDDRRRAAEHRQTELAEQSHQLDVQRALLDTQSRGHARELERIAGLSAEQAKSELMSSVEANARRDAA